MREKFSFWITDGVMEEWMTRDTMYWNANVMCGQLALVAYKYLYSCLRFAADSSG